MNTEATVAIKENIFHKKVRDMGRNEGEIEENKLPEAVTIPNN
jgi:hypothetical protein